MKDEGGGSSPLRPSSPRLLLIGGGHSHLFVLEDFARRPPPGVELIVVAPSPLATYSGMVPGVLGGRYRLRQAQIDIRRLTERAGGRFVTARVTALDPRQRSLSLDDGSRLTYALASFDIGSRTAPVPTEAGAPLVPIKPMEPALDALDSLLASRPGARAVVVGAGAAGCEVALALAARLRRGGGSVTVCDRNPRPVPELAPRTAAVIERAFAAAGVTWLAARTVSTLTADGVRFADGRLVPAALIVTAAGAVGGELFADAGLAVDERGFLLVDETLRCLQHPEIFAAGDCATLAARRALPKSGVYAVRQGPLLAANLRAALRDAPLRPFRPQPRTLALLNTADGRAILSYGALAAHGRWAMRLKDWIDRRFIRRFDG